MNGQARLLDSGRSTVGESTRPHWLTVAVVAVVILSPILAAIGCLLVLASTHRRAIPAAGYVVVVSVTALFAVMNVGKAVTGDWIWYTDHYRLLEVMPLTDYLGGRVDQFQPAVTEPVYYSLSFVLARLTDANVAVLGISVTAVIYVTFGSALVAAAQSMTRERIGFIVAVTVPMLMGLTFTLSTALVRQEVAAAFICAAIVALGLRRHRLAVLFSGLAVLSHNSALIPAAAIALAFITTRRDAGMSGRVVVTASIFYGLGRYYLTIAETSYLTESDGSISAAVVLLDVLIMCAFLLVYRNDPEPGGVARVVLLCLPAFYGFVLAVSALPIPLLRMYFYIEVLRALMLCCICARLCRRRGGGLIGAVLVGAAVVYAQFRILASPFIYEHDLVGLLFNTPLSG